MTQLDYTFDRQIMLEREEARREGREEGREEGHEEGFGEGECRQLIRQVYKKRAKRLSPEDAADQLECDIEQIRNIYHVMDSLKTTDIDTVYKKLTEVKISEERATKQG